MIYQGSPEIMIMPPHNHDPLKRLLADRERRVEESIEILISQLSGGSIPYRVKAAEALGRAGDIRALPSLIRIAANDPEIGVRHVAVRSIGRLGDPGGVECLVSLLDDEDRWIRKEAARSLGEIGEPSSLPFLAALLGDPKDDVRAAAADALGRLGDQSAVDILCDAVRDHDPKVRTSARESLRELGRDDLSRTL